MNRIISGIRGVMAALMLMMASGALWAADEVPGVVIVGMDGSQRSFALSGVDRIEVGNYAFTVKETDGTAVTADYDNVDRVLIGAPVSDGIQAVMAEGEVAVWPTVTTGIVNVEGCPEATLLRVFSISGDLVKTLRVTSSTTAVIDLSAHPAGMYLIVIDGNRSVKVIKK